MAAAPMFADQKPLGVLGVFSSETHAFDEQQLTLLRALAEHAAAAIDNHHLLKQLRESEQQLREQAAELTRALVAHRALDEIARRLVDVADAAEVLQEVVDTASDLLGFGWCAPDADQRRQDSPAADSCRAAHRAVSARLAAYAAFPHGRWHQRSRGT